LIRIHAGQKLLRYEDTGQAVRIYTSDQPPWEAQALVGADGLWSTVRANIVGDGPPRRSGHLCYRCITPTESIPEPLRRNSMALWVGPRCSLVLWPMRQNKFYNVTAVFHSDRQVEGWDTRGQPEELYKGFAETCPQVQEVLRRVEDWRFFVLSDRDPIRNWSKGRITLLGDAAHPMQQYLAQGACMAMEDAVVLASAVNRHVGDFEKAFQTYQSARYLRTARVQLTARLYGHVYHAEGAVADLRNHFIESRTPAQTMESMAWLYEPSLEIS
jgi:salicylate hydroxylase